jgi:hypothetical protein
MMGMITVNKGNLLEILMGVKIPFRSIKGEPPTDFIFPPLETFFPRLDSVGMIGYAVIVGCALVAVVSVSWHCSISAFSKAPS